MARVDNTGGSGFTVDNGTGLVVRTKLNQVIGALSTLNQGSGEMSIGVAAYVPHIDGNTLKIRNAANNAFVSLGDVSLANFGHASLSSANTFTARATFSVTSSITLPSGTTAQRDGSPAVGMIRHNSETNTFEGYNNGAWGSLGSGSGGISNVVEDTSPQLGGNLDVQAFELNTSTSNGNLKLNPNGTGVVEVKGDGSSTNGKVQLNCSQNSHGVKLESPDHSASQSYTIKLPDNQIAADKFLKVKSISGSGSTAIGQLEFADGGGGLSSDAQENTVGGTNAGDSFDGTNAIKNTLIGKDAGTAITSGDSNVAIGHDALKTLTTNSTNVAIGDNALELNTAAENVAVGAEALASNTSGTNNTALGTSALSSNQTGIYNTAVGWYCMQANTGSRNTAVGMGALQSSQSGDYNVSIGNQCMVDATGANYNMGFGYRALRYAQSGGNSNTGLGTFALQALTTGYSNHAIGYGCLDNVTTGIRNIGIGHNAGDTIVTGSSNIYFGRDADASSSSVGQEIVFGQGLTGKGTSTAYLGGSAGVYNSDNTSSWSTTSDERIKKNIVDNNIGLDAINQIQIKNFEYRRPEEVDSSLPSHSAIDKEGIQVGVIAQEIQKVLPDVVKEMSTGCLSVNPDNLTWYLVNAVKELSAKVTALEKG